MATTLGKPAIPTPGALDLRALQQTIDNIRERFARLEAAVALSGRTVAASQTATTGDLKGAIAALRAEVDALVASVSSAGDDLAPAPRPARAAEDDVAPRGASRAQLRDLADRIEAIELEPTR